MTRASEVLAEAPKPERTVALPPSAWVATYDKRPVGEVAVGLRFLSQEEAEAATIAAEAHAADSRLTGDARTTCFNTELMVQAVGSAVCDPNRADHRYFTLRAADVRKQLTPDAVQRLWDELELARVAASPLVLPADDEDLADLGERLLDPDGLAHLDAASDLMLRRWARTLLDLLLPP